MLIKVDIKILIRNMQNFFQGKKFWNISNFIDETYIYPNPGIFEKSAEQSSC